MENFGTLMEAVAHYAKQTPQAVCLVDADKDSQCTYSAFWQMILHFSARLRRAGLQKGDRVVVRVGPLIETLVAQFGIYMAGGVYCPVEKNMQHLKLIEMLDYFDAAFLISSDETGYPCTFIALHTVCDAAPGVRPENHVFPDPEALATIVFTTGTTGKAKGVMLSYKAILFFAKRYAQAYGYLQSDVFLWVQPLDRVNGIRHFSPCMMMGGTCVHFSGIIFVHDFFKTVGKYNVTALYFQPYALNVLLASMPDGFEAFSSQLRILAIGGSFVAEKTKDALKKLLPDTRLFINYGATEVSPLSYYEFGLQDSKPNCVGKAMNDVDLILMDDNNDAMDKEPPNKLGTVAAACDGLMLGYWKGSNLTREAFCGGRLMMTDMGFWGEDGLLYLMGRKDDVIVSGGFKIAPYEIESIVCQMPGVAECACIAVSHNVLGNVPKLFVVMKPNAEFSAKEIMGYLSERVETFKLPWTMRHLEKLPKVDGGTKINQKELRDYD